jgi:hypothetical protein
MSRPLVFALGSFAFAAIFLAFANTGVDPGENGGGREYLITLAIDAVVVAVLFWLVPRWADRPDIPALVLAALAAVTVAVFFLGFPPLFAGAVAYLVLGVSPRSTRATVALAVAGLAAAAFAVLCVVG